jgi:hypothetical protein
MDAPSHSVIAFLETLQDASQRLYQVRQQFLRHGAQPRAGGMHLSSRERECPSRGFLCFAILVKGSDGNDYDLGVHVLWSPERWVITTEAWMDVETGQKFLRACPERTASDIDTCKEHIVAAVGDLASFVDVVPGKAGEP